MLVVNTSRGEIQETAGQRRGEMEAGGETSLFISSLNLDLVACYILRGTTCRLLSVLKIYNCQELRTLNLNLNLNLNTQPQPPPALRAYQSLSASQQLLTRHTPATDLWSNFWKMWIKKQSYQDMGLQDKGRDGLYWRFLVGLTWTTGHCPQCCGLAGSPCLSVVVPPLHDLDKISTK